MTFIEEWQLVAHSPNLKLTHAEALVALAIARRIESGQNSTRLSISTLLAESVAINSRATIQRALEGLEALGVIELSKTRPGSRTARSATWTLTCPGDCQLDHSKANKKLSKTRLERDFEAAEAEGSRPRHAEGLGRDTRNDWDALRIKKEREGVLEFISQELSEMPSKGERHKQLEEAIADQELSGEVRIKAEQLALKAENDPRSYLRSITRNSPQKLLPALYLKGAGKAASKNEFSEAWESYLAGGAR